MWYLISEHDKRILYVLPGKDIILGRSLDGQNCNFAIPEDASISRKHATLSISEGSLVLKDLGSKYGTFVNNNPVHIEPNVVTKLNYNDIVKLGKITCVWKVQQINFTTCTSTLKGENLQNLRNILGKIGGTLKNEWDDSCAYLTMPAITLTIKVVLALVQNSHIITVDYWNKCLESINNQTSLPNPSNFIPQILESTLNKENVSFLPKQERSTLFAGKKVIFFSRRQLELYKNVLSKSSASALLLSESKMTKSALCDDDVIIIQYNISSTSQDSQAQKDQIENIIDYLKSKGKRVVADAEIGLAILYCSTVKYCNPGFNFSSEVIKQVACQKNDKNILAPESEEPSMNLCKNENMIINETLTPSNNHSITLNNDQSNTFKRKLSENDDSDNSTNTNKKLAVDANKLGLRYNKKRQNESNDSENPSKKIAIASNDDEDDVFKFTKNDSAKTNDTNKTSKKLNLSKPMKRKMSTDDDEDLFNFVNKGNKKTAIDRPTESVSDNLQDSDECVSKTSKSIGTVDEKVDISALRGSKLDELMKKASNTAFLKHIKKEDISELDEKFGNIDIGSTTLILRKDLIVKKEPIQVQTLENGLKNFKKFKKVWPVKMQITMLPKSAATVIKSIDESTEELVL